MPERNESANQGSGSDPEINFADTLAGALAMVARHRWWILGTAFCVPMVVIAVAMKLPDHYISHATLLVVQQQVSQRYVEPDSTTTTQAAIQAMKLEVLSRQRLLSIINDVGLYPTARDRSPELLAEKMREEIEIQALETPSPGRNDFNGFTISFTAGTPQLAQEVISRLTSLFIEQNLKTRGDQAASTTKFLSDRLDAAKQRLTQQEQRLQAFMTNNLGELPEQQQSNILALSSARERLETVTSNLLEAKQQQSSLQLPLSERLARLQTEKNALLVNYTSQYPEVVKKDREIAKVRTALEQLRTNAPSSEAPQAESTDDPELDTILRQAEGIVGHIENLSQQQKRLQTECEQYQKHLNLTPLREQQLAEILRDYNLYKQDYTDLSNKTLQSQMATSLEERQEGQQFRLVDPPSLPVKPSSPKRLNIALGGFGGGIVLGLVLAFLMDLRDSSFHSEKSLVQSFSLPLVMGVPLVRTPGERRVRHLRIAVEFIAGCVMILTVFAAEFYVFKNG